MPARDRLLALTVALLWGTNFLALRVGLDHLPPMLFAALRFAVIAVPTVLFVPRPAVPLRWLLGYGLGFGTLQFVFLFAAMGTGMPTGLASLVLQASAPFTVLLGWALLRERVSPRQAVGIGLAVLGMVAIAISRAQVAAVLPVLLTLLGALGWALGNLAARRALAAAPEANPMHLMLWMTVVPPLPLLALSFLTEGPGTDGAALAGIGLPALAALAYTALLATVLGSGIWTVLMRRHPAGVVAPYSLLVPVFGIALSALFLGERPGAVELVAGVVIVGGVLLGTPRPAGGGRLSPVHAPGPATGPAPPSGPRAPAAPCPTGAPSR